MLSPQKISLFLPRFERGACNLPINSTSATTKSEFTRTLYFCEAGLT